jgi:glutamate decarboxylase
MAGIALKRRWTERGHGERSRPPNIVLSGAAHVAWFKFANYADVETRVIPVAASSLLMEPSDPATIEAITAAVDANTIGLVTIMGSTYTGAYEDVSGLSLLLDQIQRTTGHNVRIHVDAASGGFVAPFLSPRLRWDFWLKRVVSINVSGHKFGMVYAGLGWLIFRDRASRPESLVHHSSYLGGSHPTFGITYSRPAAPILAQYFNFMKLGRRGYSEEIGAMHHQAHALKAALRQQGLPFHFYCSLDAGLPVVAWSTERCTDAFKLSRCVKKEGGWSVPAYLAPQHSHVVLMRVVIRAEFTTEMGQTLANHLSVCVKQQQQQEKACPEWQQPVLVVRGKQSYNIH